MDLPLDILEQIIRKLGNKDLSSMACVNYLCKQLVDREKSKKTGKQPKKKMP
jgi:hypothetical protein